VANKVTSVTIHYYGAQGSSKRTRYGIILPSTFSGIFEATGALTEWRSGSLSETALTNLNGLATPAGGLEEMIWVIEKNGTSGHDNAYEIYMSVAVEGHGTFNIFVKEVSSSEWTEIGGSALEAIGKTTVEPTAPSTAKFLESPITEGAKVKGKFTITTALKEAIEPVIAAGLLPMLI
jgi:hypothetical protein